MIAVALVACWAAEVGAALVLGHGWAWTERVPRATIALWQALAVATVGTVCTGAVLAIAATFGGLSRAVAQLRFFATDAPAHYLTPNELFAVTAGLIALSLASIAILTRAVGILRARARHRQLLDLVTSSRADLPNVRVVPTDVPTAYCLPGHRSRIVVSEGALAVLGEGELAAVLAHERAHVSARHHLVLLPFAVFGSMVPSVRTAGRVRESVRELIEMAADDRATDGRDRHALARALCRLSTATTPTLAFAADGGSTARRVVRLLSPSQSHRWLAAVVACAAAAAVVAPVVAVVLGARG